MDKRAFSAKNVALVAIMAVSLMVIGALLYSGISYLWKASLTILVLYALSKYTARSINAESMFGAYLLSSKKGISTIYKIADSHPKLWNALADWGMVIGFGAVAKYFFKNISKKTVIIGIVSILFVLYIMLPFSYLAFSFINLPQTSSGSVSGQQATGINIAAYALTAIAVIGGFAGFIAATLVYSSWSILYSIAAFAASAVQSTPNYGIIASQAPGVAPIIPGINIPLAAGVIALALILVVHEFSHGILARVARIKIKRVGLLVFGLIPIGAFVEPEEKKVKKLKKDLSNRIFIAGVSANMLTAMLFFVVMMFFALYVIPSIMTQSVVVTAVEANSPAYNTIPVGSTILEWQGVKISNISSFVGVAGLDKPFNNISVVTNKGTFSLISNAAGKIGVYVNEQSFPKQGILSGTGYFAYSVAALSFLLSFLIAVVNLLPIPGFDGFRIYGSVMSKKNLRLLGSIAILALVINALPWIWHA